MNEEEIKDILELFERHGWSPRLCDTPDVSCQLSMDVDFGEASWGE